MIGILLVNLGTPDSPEYRDVFRYLNEFLTDGRVIDRPWLLRQLLVRGLIVPKRCGNTTKTYKAIWSEAGSPLLFYGKKVRNRVQKSLGEGYKVVLAMRYQNPSIEKGLEELKGVSKLVVIPFFPQYASATTGSVHQEVMRVISQWTLIPELHLIDCYANNPKMIEAFCSKVKNAHEYDHVIMSFHGLPEAHLRKEGCPINHECCKTYSEKNRHCYRAGCYETARKIGERLGVSYSISYQSRLGKEPWFQPFTSDVLKKLAAEGKKKVLVFCPSFVADCLETIYEIDVELQEEFLAHGGERLDLAPSLNDNPIWAEALVEIVQNLRRPELVGIGV